MCGKDNGSHVCPSTATAAAAATGRQRSQFSDFVFQCKVRAAVSTEHFEHFLSQDRLFYQTTTPHHTKLQSVLFFWRESGMPLVQGIHMDPK